MLKNMSFFDRAEIRDLAGGANCDLPEELGTRSAPAFMTVYRS